MLRNLSYALGLLLLAAPATAQKANKNAYQYRVDLAATANDRVPVRLTVPAQTQDVATFNIPKVIPGTYADYDFGRFIHNVQALDAKGKALPVEKSTPNTWTIKNAKSLAAITYEVEDTWDTDMKDKFVFEPGGTNIEKDSAWVVGNGGFFGYLNNAKQVPFEVTFVKPAGFYGSTALVATSSTATEDKFQTSSYMHLIDSPFLYTKPDTTWINVGNTKVLISVYSKTGRNKSAEFKDALAQTLNAQKNYLGGNLPVEKYAFLIYLNPEGVGYKSSAAGALEHSYSSLYTLFEGDPAQLAEGVKDIAAHEFFHIVTPLTVHAEEIGNFDYINPKMSKHLWLYEGVTEYFAQHALVHEKIVPQEQFVEIIRQKMLLADRYGMDGMSFTEMSKNVLDPAINDKYYGNVYQKGALIGLCLDVKLRQLSGGKYTLVKLLQDLGKTYGKDKSFEDDKLFDEIARVSGQPSIKEFLVKYVEGKEPLPLTEVFEAVGITYAAEFTENRVSLGGVSFGYNQQSEKIFVPAIRDTNNVNLKAMGLKVGDVIEEVEGQALTAQNANQLLGGWARSAGPAKLTVSRTQANGTTKTLPLSANLVAVDVKEKHRLAINPTATPEQVALRKAWLEQ